MITETGNVNLSEALPRSSADVETMDGIGVGRGERLAMTPTRLNEPPSSVIAWAWYVDGVSKPATSLSEAARLACAGEGFVWLGLKDPSDADLVRLSSQFDLHPLAIEDAVHGHTRSKLEVFDDDLFMVISTVAYVAHERLTETSEVVATGQVMIFLGDHFVITVRRGEHAPLSALRRSLEADPAGWPAGRRRCCTRSPTRSSTTTSTWSPSSRRTSTR